MPVIYEEALKKEIKDGNFSPVYIIYGEDSYLKKHYTDTIIDKVCGNDSFFNFQSFEREADMRNLYDAVNQLPMMADKKCVLLDDYDYERADKTAFENLCELLSDVPDTCVFILRFDAIEFGDKKNSKATKLIKCAEKSGGKAVCLGHRSAGQLSAMLIRGAKKRGVDLPHSVADYLIEISSGEITVLQNELDKLCTYSKDGTITKETVDKICSKTVEASVYDYVKYIIDHDILNALKLLDDMFFMRIEPIIILYNVSSAYVDMLRAFYANEKNVPNENISEDFEYNRRSFLIGKAKTNLKRFNFSSLKKSFDLIMKADTLLKSSGAEPKIILEEMTVSLALLTANG